jgi:hypothetical protein
MATLLLIFTLNTGSLILVSGSGIIQTPVRYREMDATPWVPANGQTREAAHQSLPTSPRPTAGNGRTASPGVTTRPPGTPHPPPHSGRTVPVRRVAPLCGARLPSACPLPARTLLRGAVSVFPTSPPQLQRVRSGTLRQQQQQAGGRLRANARGETTTTTPLTPRVFEVSPRTPHPYFQSTQGRLAAHRRPWHSQPLGTDGSQPRTPVQTPARHRRKPARARRYRRQPGTDGNQPAHAGCRRLPGSAESIMSWSARVPQRWLDG